MTAQTHKCLKCYENKALFPMHTLIWLEDSGGDVIREGSCQLLGIRSSYRISWTDGCRPFSDTKIVGGWTAHKMEYDLSDCSWLFGREEDLHGVHTTQPHRLAKGAQSREKHCQQGSKSFISSVVDQNNIDHFFFSSMNRVSSTKNLCLQQKQRTLSSVY